MMKKMVSRFLLAALLLAALTGCGKETITQPEETKGGVTSKDAVISEDTVISESSEDYSAKKSLSDFHIVTTCADKVILDCDMSYVNDDAFALMFLLQADKLGYIDLMGIVVSGGNKVGAVAVNVALLQLEAVGRTDIPVYIGQDEPLKGFNVERSSQVDWPGEVYSNLDKYVTPDNYHNLGDLYSPAWGYSETEAQKETASEFMTGQVKQYPGEITILCIGPTTNVAKACLEDETFAENTAGIIYMGGNTTDDAGFNWWYDADAVKVCLESEFPKQTICTSEISGTMRIPAQFFDELSQYDNSAVATFFAKRSTIAGSNKKLWDVVISAIFMCPELISESSETVVSVSVENSTYGEMKVTEKGTKATVISEVKGPDVFALMRILFGEEE